MHSSVPRHAPRFIRQSFATSPRQNLLRASLTGSSLRASPFQPQRRHASSPTKPASQTIIHPLIPPPSSASGPLLTRLPNRELPSLSTPGSSVWLRTLPIFLFLITASSLAIFNYQKSSSSTVNSILYALRTNATARAILGDEIYFASKVPWISGELNQLHGNIDISFWVKGTKESALTKFVSVRRKRNGYFETLEWSLQTKDGKVVQLLDVEGTRDPMGETIKE